jgi:regulatory protein
MAAMSESYRLSKAASYAHRLLSYRPRSEKEIIDKLRTKGFEPDIIEGLVTALKKRNIINDTKFAKLWAESRLYINGHGPDRIKQELKAKGICEDIIYSVTSGLKNSADEYETVRKLAGRKAALLKGITQEKARQRLYAYLKRRGFPNETICRVLNETY